MPIVSACFLPVALETLKNSVVINGVILGNPRTLTPQLQISTWLGQSVYIFSLKHLLAPFKEY